MNSIFKFPNFSIWLTSACLALCLLTAPAHAQEVSGVMMVVKGDVKITGKDGKADSGKVGKKVAAGDTVTAGADSRAKIVMADKNVLNISPDSKVVIEKYENDGKDKKNVELNVVYGKLRAGVEQKYDGEKSKFNVKTPSAVAGVRGTDFITSYNPVNKISQVITFSGTVAFGQAGPGGRIQNPVFVRPGQTTTVGQGTPPEPPKNMPKEDLNKANSETKADSALNNGKSEENKKVGAGDKDKEQAKEKENAKESGKESENRKDKEKDKLNAKEVEVDKKESTTSPSNSNSTSTSTSEPNEPRAPANTTVSMTDSADLGTAPIANSPAVSLPAGLAPSGLNFMAPPPSTFLNDAIQNNQKSKVQIILAPK